MYKNERRKKKGRSRERQHLLTTIWKQDTKLKKRYQGYKSIESVVQGKEKNRIEEGQ